MEKEKEKDSIVIAKECWEERERREKEKRKAYARGRVLVRWGELVGGSMAKPMEITLTLFFFISSFSIEFTALTLPWVSKSLLY